MKAKHPWQARLAVGLIMLALAFLGMVTTDVHSTGGFDYWKWIIPVYALLALWLSWYMKRQMETVSAITLVHELGHWAGLVAAVFLVSLYVKLGIVSRYAAGFFDLTLLSLAVFLAGVYIEKTFLFIGLVLALFAILAAWVVEYLYAFTIPILIAGVAIVGLMVWHSHKKHNQS